MASSRAAASTLPRVFALTPGSSRASTARRNCSGAVARRAASCSNRPARRTAGLRASGYTEDRLGGSRAQLGGQGAGGARCRQPVEAWAPPRVPSRQRGPHARAGHGLAVLGTVPVTLPLEAIHGQRVSRRAGSASNTHVHQPHRITHRRHRARRHDARRSGTPSTEGGVVGGFFPIWLRISETNDHTLCLLGVRSPARTR